MIRQFLLTTCAVALMSAGSMAQTVVKNDGAMFVVEPGATVLIQGGLENVNGGTINNDGTIEIQGDFLNSATFDGTDANTVIFSGTGASNVTSGGAIFDDVQIDKADGINVNLNDDMTVKGDLTFEADNNKVVLGANDLTIQGTGTIGSFDENEYVMTNGDGYLIMEDLDENDTYVFPVGNGAYNPATIAGNAGHVEDDFSVRVRPNLYNDGLTEGDQATEGGVDAMWDITEAVADGSDVDVTLQWAASDELTDFDRANSAVTRHDGMTWDMLFGDIGAAGGTDPYTRTRDNVTDFSAFGVASDKTFAAYVESDLQVFLQGAYLGSGVQTDALRGAGVIPTDEPYFDSLGYVHTGFGGDETVVLADLNQGGNNDGVDWVLIELRDSGDPTIVVASRAAILQEDGDIVDVDGTSFPKIYGVAPGDYYVAVKQRNHLGAMSANPITFMDMGSFDFTDPGSAIYGVNPVTTADGGSTNVFWTGDVNNSGFTNSTDISILAPVAASGLTDVYNLLDVNLSSFVNSSDLAITAPLGAIGPVEQIPN